MNRSKFGCPPSTHPCRLNVIFGAVLGVADDVAWCLLLPSSRHIYLERLNSIVLHYDSFKEKQPQITTPQTTTNPNQNQNAHRHRIQQRRRRGRCQGRHFHSTFQPDFSIRTLLTHPQVGNALGGITKTAGGLVGTAGRGVGETINNTTGTKAVGDGLQGITGGIEDGANSAGKGVENAGQGKKSW